MTLISPNKHLLSTVIGVTLTAVSRTLIKYSIASGSPNFYSGKPVTVAFAGASYQCTYRQVWDGTQWNDWLDFGAADISGFALPGSATIVDSFERNASADNESVTARDIMTSMLATDDTLTVRGNPGLSSGLQSLKATLGTVPYQCQQLSYENSTGAYQCVALVATPPNGFTDFVELRAVLSNGLFSAEFVIKYSVNLPQVADGDGRVTEPWSVECVKFDAYSEPGLSVTLNVLRQYTGTPLIGLYARFDGIASGSPLLGEALGSTVWLTSLGQLVPGTILPPTDGSPGSVGNFFFDIQGTAQNALGNYSVSESQDLAFAAPGTYTRGGLSDPTLLGYGKLKPLAIPDGADLDIYSFPGSYSYYGTDNASLSNAPTPLIVSAFNLEVSPLSPIGGLPDTRQVLQRLESYTIDDSDLTHSCVWERVSDTDSGALTWSNWEQVGKAIHTHVPGDILTNDSAMFVTAAQIAEWDSIIGVTSNWLDPADTFDDLSGDPGNVQMAADTGILYGNFGGTWVPLSINALPTADDATEGLLAPSDYINFSRVSMSRQIGTTNRWVFQTNAASVYGSGYAMLPTDAIDLVARATGLGTALGEKSIGIGFGDSTQTGAGAIAIGGGNTAGGANAIALGNLVSTAAYAGAVGIGSNLLVNAAGAVALGQWNASMTGLVFAVGNGTGAGARNNIFSVDTSAITHVAGGYGVDGKSGNDLLTGDGGSTSASGLQASIVAAVLSAGSKTILYLKAGFDTFELDWSGWVAQYGQFANLQAHSLVGKNQYSVEQLPIIVNTQWLNPPDANPTLPYLDLGSTTFVLSGTSWQVNAQALLASGEATGYTLSYMDEEGSAWVPLGTAGIDGTFAALSVDASLVPNGMQLQIAAISAGTVGPVYHVWDDSGTLELWDVEYGEDPTVQQYVNKSLQAVSYIVELGGLEAMLIIS